MLPQEVIRTKRDAARALTRDEIESFVTGITNGAISDAQIAAFAMAVFFNGMNRDETVALTLAMRDSGSVLDWTGLGRPSVDKHSTGGVGDNVSLMLAPIVAACGVAVPMISGRGLGHTGGTLDKMDAIPGYVSQPDSALFRKVTDEIGCAIIGQTADLAPADKRFYGVRDVTATVENLSLITASILSKKLAAGLDALVLDVKFGSGAFMDSVDKARELAGSLVAVANGAGTPTVALLTDMNQPLASAAGNAEEVANAVRFLTGKARDSRLETVTMALAAEMLLAGKVATTVDEGLALARRALTSGQAAETFGRMVAALGGSADFVERCDDHLPKAPLTAVVSAPLGGTVTGIDTRGIGVAVVELGGGRRRREDNVDLAVGLTDLVGLGANVAAGDRIATVHARDAASLERATAAVLAAYRIGGEKGAIGPVIAERIVG